MSNLPEEMVAQERSALALWLLMQAPLTTRQIADKVGLQHESAREMLCRISRAVPLYFDGRFWRVLGRGK